MTGLFWAVAAAALALDVGSKLWAVRSLEQAVTGLPGVLELRLSRNNGMALGLLSGNWLANLLLPLAVPSSPARGCRHKATLTFVVSLLFLRFSFPALVRIV